MKLPFKFISFLLILNQITVNGQQPINYPDTKLIGEWRNVYLKIVVHHGNSPVETMEADSTNWEEKLKIHPIRTHFESNGTYYSEYFNLKDSIVRRPTGIWALKGDSLTMTQLTPHKSVYRFLLKIKDNWAIFNGNIDFDGDGHDDDSYYGIQKKYIGLTSRAQSSRSLGQGLNAILQQTKIAMGLTDIKKPVLHYYNQISLHREQSNRTYPPYFTTSVTAGVWLLIETNTTLVKSKYIGAGCGTGNVPNTYYTGVSKYYFVSDTVYTSSSSFRGYDKLNAWTVLLDWAADSSVTQIKKEVYRDYERLVFERPALIGNERLFIDPKTYLPVKLDYEELSSLWGQQHIEIVYSIWQVIDGCLLPVSSSRMEDGVPMICRTLGKSELCDSVSVFTRINQLPITAQKNFNNDWYFSEQPKIKLSEQTYVSKNIYYSEVFTKIGNTVYFLDATINQERAMQDEKLISQVFPGVSKYIIVVTDLAWLHIGGLRYWVSKGATIVSHIGSKEFLEKVVSRKWAIRPDELQKHPQKMEFVAINKMIILADGAFQVFPIDGIGSEGAACNLVRDKLLWASDYIQGIKLPRAYAKEVINAVKREGVQPEKVVTEHI